MPDSTNLHLMRGEDPGKMSSQAETRRETTSDPIMSALIGIVAGALTEILADLPAPWRLLIAIAVALVYQRYGGRIFRSPFAARPGQAEARNRKSANYLSVGLVAAIALFLVEGLITGIEQVTALLITLWLALMIVLVQAGVRAVQSGSVVPALSITLAAASFGAAIGGSLPVVIDTIVEPRAALSIENRCDEPLVASADIFIDELLEVPPNGSQETEALRAVIEVRYNAREAQFRATYIYDESIELPGQVASVSFDGRDIPPETWETIDLRDGDSHQLVITCA